MFACFLKSNLKDHNESTVTSNMNSNWAATMEYINTLSEAFPADADGRLARYLAWLFVFVICALIFIGFCLGLLALVSSDGAMNPFSHLFFLPFMTIIYGLTGLLISRQHPDNKVGWLLLLVGVFSALTLIGGSYSEFAIYVIGSQTGRLAEFFVWFGKWVWIIPSLLPLTMILLYFPDGNLPSPRWNWLVWLTGLGIVGMIISYAFFPAPLPEFGLPDNNPYGIPGSEAILEIVLNVANIFLVIGLLGAFTSLFVRYRRGNSVQRVQLKWLLLSVTLALVALFSIQTMWYFNPDDLRLVEMGIAVTSAGVTAIIVAIGIAILRHNLWDVDILINRTVVYGLLTAIVTGIYVLSVSFLSVLFDGDTLFFSLLATAIVAVSFQPLRDWIARRINRLMFGHRDEPYVVLEQLSLQLTPLVAVDEILPAIVKSIAEAVQLPYVAVMLRYDGINRLAAAYPTPEKDLTNITVEMIPLVYQSDTIGQLVLAPRSHHEPFTPTERSLFNTIARQVAVAAYNVRLTEDLQRSREQIVITREEERRRLRRDLHDGLGPVLAAMSFQLDAIHNFVEHNPGQAQQLTRDVKLQVQAVLSEIRRIAYNLRPPALDELGLLEALRQHIESTHQPDGLNYQLVFPSSLPTLPAAVEVAAYRIIMEAITNVQRHANALTCNIRIEFDAQAGYLSLDIIDDGCGMVSTSSSGVGLTAMRERTAELNGKFAIETDINVGTHVRAQLPLHLNGKT